MRDVQIAIIGSGFGGIGMAIRLKQEGIEDFVIFERANDVGGVWRDNTYPGCACDVQSHLYSLSFVPNPDWTRSFSPQTEIWDYLRRCAKDFNLLPHICFEHSVNEAVWENETQRWRIETSRGTFFASVLISAAGSFSEPKLPQWSGMENFKGKVFHSSRWDHDFEIERSRVAVIGTGASAIQFVPAIQPLVEQLHLFQRTAPWIVKRHDRPFAQLERKLFRSFPQAQLAMRGAIYSFREVVGFAFRHPWAMRLLQPMARRHLKRSVADPVLRAKLTPHYLMGCKRVLISNDYFPALTQPNVELVTDGIAEIREHSVVGNDGVERPVDAIIFGTGFHVSDFPFASKVRGRNGQTLNDVWAGSPQALAGTTVTGFPNLFLLPGPNTGLGHSSVLYMLEAQIEHSLSAVLHMKRHGITRIEARPDAQAAYVAAVDKNMRGTVWTSGGCLSWYLDVTGRNSTLWPTSSWKFRRRVARFAAGEYVME
ncbi:MAG TPA: NAD(P)/FAD-dependent oxidoreductase [Pyrinomonadaceae bacterium]|jgi:cation diffusion facilitator CzcD-associated flavoprotein CzcO|nr:NAD(P)/FAD-dependent oxidoreductase [Pyrinomonadaceae bacterium]